jgi:hypothetical protein
VCDIHSFLRGGLPCLVVVSSGEGRGEKGESVRGVFRNVDIDAASRATSRYDRLVKDDQRDLRDKQFKAMGERERLEMQQEKTHKVSLATRVVRPCLS